MSAKFDERAVRYISDLIRDFKYEDYQAAGYPGNFGVESGGFTKTQETGMASGRGGLGDAQWTGSRRVAFEAWLARPENAAKGWTSWDYDADYSMLFRELTGPERAAAEAVRAARDVDEATEIVMRRYERPGVEALERRKEYGRQALAAFRGAGIDAAALRAPGRPGAAAPAAKDGEILPPAILGERQPLDLGRVLAALLPLLQYVITDPKLRDAVLPLVFQILGVKPADAEPAKPAASVNPVTKGSLLAGLGALLVGGGAQLNGSIPPPVGETSTLLGIVTTLAPIAIAAFGGPIGGYVSKFLGGFTIARKP